MAKHGNRSASSKSGAADVLEALDVNLNVSKENLELALKELNFAFLMAPNHHSAMKHVAKARSNLKHRTIFNLLGPLANPAGTKRQLIGVFDKKWLTPMAEALRNLETEKAWIVHGSDGMDEITVTGPTNIAILRKDKIEELELMPEDFGSSIYSMDELKGGDAKENAEALNGLLNGDNNAYKEIALINAAAVISIHGDTADLQEARKLAKNALDTGKTKELLMRYIEFTKEHSL
jgi:anthranilate phosphoribosyltransferase